MRRAVCLLVSALLVCYGTAASVRTAAETYKYVGDRLWNIYAYGGLLGTSSVTSVSKALEFNKFGGVDPYVGATMPPQRDIAYHHVSRLYWQVL